MFWILRFYLFCIIVLLFFVCYFIIILVFVYKMMNNCIVGDILCDLYGFYLNILGIIYRNLFIIVGFLLNFMFIYWFCLR